jgi:murein DD-endopeptidase MepM/ murein hydrolase activator NlpD
VYPTKPGDVTGYRGQTGLSGDIGKEELTGEKVQGSTSLPKSLFVTHQPWAGKSAATTGQTNTGGDTCHPTPFKNQELGNGRKEGRAGGHARPFALGKPSDSASSGSGNSKKRRRGSSQFDEKAPAVMKKLQEDFGLTREQAAGVVGNLGHESGGFGTLQEISPNSISGAGGFGWAQWTDVISRKTGRTVSTRRTDFFNFAERNGLDPRSDEANYGFLKQELQTTHRYALNNLKRTSTVDEAMRVFERDYEGAGVKHYDSRLKYANRAYNSTGDGKFGGTQSPPKESNPPQKTSGADGPPSDGKGTNPIESKNARFNQNYLQRRGNRSHQGVDISVGTGTPIKAWKDGVVVLVRNSPGGYGKYAIVKHGNKYHTLYAHCSSVDVSKGQQVKEGQVIAKVGSTGRSTGPHLHFEVREIGRPPQGLQTGGSLSMAKSYGGTHNPYDMFHKGGKQQQQPSGALKGREDRDAVDKLTPGGVF